MRLQSILAREAAGVRVRERARDAVVVVHDGAGRCSGDVVQERGNVLELNQVYCGAIVI